MSPNVDNPLRLSPVTLWRYAALAWALPWALSLLLPAAHMAAAPAVPGWKVLLGGWSAGLVMLTLWMANPFAVVLAGWVVGRRRPFKGLGLLTCALGLLSIPALWPMTGVAIGYWLWVASFLPLAVADALTFRTPAPAPSPPGSDALA